MCLASHCRGASLIKTILSIVVLTIVVSIALYTYFAWLPKNLQGIEGMQVAQGRRVVDLQARLDQAMAQSYEVAITEAELNQYIAAKMKLTQSPIVDNYIRIKGAYVEMKQGVLEVHIEREIDSSQNIREDGTKKLSFLPFTHTVSVSVALSEEVNEKGHVIKKIALPKAYLGRSLAPGLLVSIVKPSFDVIAAYFSKEIDIAFNQMKSLKVEDGVIKLYPHK